MDEMKCRTGEWTGYLCTTEYKNKFSYLNVQLKAVGNTI